MALPRYYQVWASAPNSGGNYSTWQAAFDAAVAAGATTNNRYIVEGDAFVSIENIVVPTGVVMKGQGEYATIVQGTVTFHSGTVLMHFTAQPNISDPANTFALRYVNDSSNVAVLRGVKAVAWGNHAGIVSTIELTGAGSSFLQVMGCYFYVKNNYTGDNSSGASKMVGVRLASDYLQYAEFFGGCHFKGSHTTLGTTQPILVLNEAVAPSTNLGYVHIAGGDWIDLHGDETPGTSKHPMLLKSANTVHEGAMIDIGYQGMHSEVPPTIEMAYSGTFRNKVVLGRRVAWAYVHRDGEDYPLSPIIRLDHTPTGADEATDGALAVIVP